MLSKFLGIKDNTHNTPDVVYVVNYYTALVSKGQYFYVYGIDKDSPALDEHIANKTSYCLVVVQSFMGTILNIAVCRL